MFFSRVLFVATARDTCSSVDGYYTMLGHSLPVYAVADIVVVSHRSICTIGQPSVRLLVDISYAAVLCTYC